MSPDITLEYVYGVDQKAPPFTENSNVTFFRKIVQQRWCHHTESVLSPDMTLAYIYGVDQKAPPIIENVYVAFGH